jgi:hypothetical protein
VLRDKLDQEVTDLGIPGLVLEAPILYSFGPADLIDPNHKRLIVP